MSAHVPASPVDDGIPQTLPPTDQGLTQRLRRGFRQGVCDMEAAGELYRRHQQALLTRARRLGASVHQADDLASEAFLRTLQAVRAGAGPADSWRPYLLTTLRRLAAREHAERKRLVTTGDLTSLRQGVTDPDGPEQRTLEQEDRRVLLQSFVQLPRRWQTVLWDTVVEQVPPREIAARHGISPTAVHALAARARCGLREAFVRTSGR